MCWGAVHPELPPRGGAASSVEEKQRVRPELPDQGIRPESAIPREPPAKPRWAGVLSPREPCSPKVPLHEGVPNTPLPFLPVLVPVDCRTASRSVPGATPWLGPPSQELPCPKAGPPFQGCHWDHWPLEDPGLPSAPGQHMGHRKGWTARTLCPDPQGQASEG